MKSEAKQNTTANKALVISISYLTLMMLGIYLAFFQYTVLSITDKFLLSAGMVGMFVAIQSIGMVVSPFILGVLSGRLGKKNTVLISYLLMIAGMLLAGGSGSTAAYICSILLVGAGYAVTEATVSAVLSDEFSSHSTMHLNFSQVCFSLGAFFGPNIASWLIEKKCIYFQNLYYFLAAIFLVIGILSMFAKHYGDHRAERKIKIFSVMGNLKDKVILFLLIAIFLYVGIENTAANFTDSYFEVQLLSPQLSHTALSLFWLAMVPSRFLAGILMKNSKGIFAGLATLSIVALILAMTLPDQTAKIVMFAVCGFGFGPLWPLIVDRIAKRSKGHTAPMLNIAFAFCGLGAAVLPFFAGLLVNAANQASAYYLCIGALFIMLVAFLWSQRHESNKLS